MRSFLTVEHLSALTTFGGLADSRNHLSIVWNIATADTVAVALFYDRMARLHLEENARARAETTLGD